MKTYECRTTISHKYDFKSKPDFKLKAKNYRDAAIKASVKFAKKFNVLYQSGLIIYVTDSPLEKPCIVHSYDILVNKAN